METTTKHTLPAKIARAPFGDLCEVVDGEPCEDSLVAWVEVVENTDKPGMTDEQIYWEPGLLEAIVTRYNNYEPLVSALRGVVGVGESYLLRETDHNAITENRKTLESARALLSQLEGQK